MRHALLRRSLLVVPLALAGVVIAEGPSATPSGDMLVLKDQKASPGTIRVSKLLDITVNDMDGNDVGHVKDVVLDRTCSNTLYVALAQGMPNAIGRKVIAVPYAAIKVGGADDDKLYVSIPDSELDKAAGIDEKAFPGQASAELDLWLKTYGKPGPAIAKEAEAMGEPSAEKAAAAMGEPGPAQWTQKSSMLIGSSVTSHRGERLGSIKDIVLSWQTGAVNYAVLVEERGLGLEGTHYAVPLDAFQIQPQTRKFTLNLTGEELKNMPAFDKDHWPSIPDPQWTALRTKGSTMP